MNKLRRYREEIDKINFKIISLIDRRIKLVKTIKKYKKQKGLGEFDREREKEMYQESKKLAKMKGLNENFIKKLLKLIIEQK